MGRNVVVTGAGCGIGLAAARHFARHGARVALLDVDAGALGDAARALAAEGHEVLAIPCDVRDEAACRAAIDQVVTSWHGVDVLVNNAGITHRSLLANTDARVLHRVMDVNFFGAVNCTQAALASVVARRGTIVAVSSVAGFSPLVGRAGYAASKHALHGFFDSVRAEVERGGVHVMLVCPAFVDTSIDAHALGGDGALSNRRKVVVGTLDTADSVAVAIVDGVVRRRRLVVLGTLGKSAWWLSRVMPSVYARVMLDRQGAEFGLDR